MAEYSVFLRLEGGQIQPPPEALPFSNEMAERLRRFHHDFPEWEMWQILKVIGNNIYHVKLGSQVMEYVRAITNEPTDFEVKDWVIVGFYKGERSRPFILAQGTVPVEAVISTSWPSFRNGNSATNCVEGTFSELGLSSGEQSYPLFIRQYASKIFSYYGSFSDENDIEGPYYLQMDDEDPIDLGEEDVWFDFQVNETGVLALISRYGYGGYDGNVTFETPGHPENGDAPLLRHYGEDNNPLWTYEFPTISEYYTWDDEGPPGSGGGSSGGGDS